MKRWSLHSILALVLAANYFGFQVELSEEEYEENHPQQPTGCAFARPGLNWESFDKQNAPEAFVFDAGLRIEFLFPLIIPQLLQPAPVLLFQPVRDKSPPLSGCVCS